MRPRLNDHLYVERASEFAAHADRSPYNAAYERPSMLDLLGDVSGLDIMDAGCGAGALLERLSERNVGSLGGVDASPNLANIAASRLGARARVWIHDLREPFAPDFRGTYDTIVCSLVLDYIEDWTSCLRNCRALLRPGGAMYFSVTHPNEAPDDVDLTHCALFEETWPSFGIRVSRYYRPLEQMLAAIATAGFALRRTLEPQPASTLLREDPGLFGRLQRRPRFLMFDLENPM